MHMAASVARNAFIYKYIKKKARNVIEMFSSRISMFVSGTDKARMIALEILSYTFFPFVMHTLHTVYILYHATHFDSSQQKLYGTGTLM